MFYFLPAAVLLFLLSVLSALITASSWRRIRDWPLAGSSDPCPDLEVRIT
jgi:hypothetical protein